MRFSKPLIAFTGPMGSGKTTALEIIRYQLLKSGYDVESIKFAQPLYDMQTYIYSRAGLEHPNTKDRKLLQFLGTEWGRGIDDRIWIDQFERHVNLVRQLYSGVVILNDDTRFNNEAELIKQLGGTLIHIQGPQRTELVGTQHASEAGIDEQYIDFILRNDQDFEFLKHNIRLLLDQLGVPR